MPRQALRPGSGRAKSPSLTQDLRVLGDIYLNLAWLAVQRLRYGPQWPWETRSGRPAAPVIALLRPQEEDEEESREAVPPRRG